MTDNDELDLGGGFYEGDWPDLLAEVARLAEKDGLRLEVYRDSDGEQKARITDKPQQPTTKEEHA
jgi:hypothetical protein